jgi:murein DD-endopeptidase MepM/ murein hydrolase activator NlpD
MNGRELPEFLYQQLPVEAMPLMATIPFGPWDISIPGATNLYGGYPILKAFPPSGNGFVIVYVRKPGGRYEASTVLYQKKSYGLETFAGFAEHLVKEHAGILGIQPDHYVYAAPAIEAWNVVLRDSGYVAWDPARMPSQYSRVVQQGQEDSGIICRIPIYGGDRQPLNKSLPAFARVDVARESDADQGPAWLNFPEYQRIREIQSAPPNSFAADFQEWIGSLREESRMASWVFHPGMLFGDSIEWWGGGDQRRTQHEGIDFAEGIRPGFGICRIPEGTPVRAIMDGESVALLDDFLGKTIVVRHSDILNSNGDVFYTLLSHIQPVTSELGFVAKGQILGSVGKSTKSRTPAHLHLTGAWIPSHIPPDTIGMKHIHPGYARITLVNFNNLIKAFA